MIKIPFLTSFIRKEIKKAIKKDRRTIGEFIYVAGGHEIGTLRCSCCCKTYEGFCRRFK